MKKLTFKPALLLIAVLLFGSLHTLYAQINFQSRSVDIQLSGTSTLHDWVMTAAKGNANATFELDASGKITSISRLSFTLPATSLKSEKTVMDNNTYKALQTKSYPNITFVLTNGTVAATGNNEYRLSCVGNLTIAGTTHLTDLVATAIYNPSDKSFTVTGVKKMKMTDYNVKPPTVMLGTIKTGNDISISYNIKFIK